MSYLLLLCNIVEGSATLLPKRRWYPMADCSVVWYGNASGWGGWLGKGRRLPWCRDTLCTTLWASVEAPKDKKQRERDVPLVGAALWAATKAFENSPNKYLFPRYYSDDGCKADYASNSLNKWLRKHVPSGCVIHSFRHSMRDRLRAVGCPSEIIDQIGGWSRALVGEQYSYGYSVGDLQKWLSKS